MTARGDFDVGPLSWVKGEIDHAIQRAQEALRAFAANSADAAQLKSSKSHLHQAHGALSIVGLEGVTRVSEELEGLLAGIEKEASLRKTEIFGLVERALNGICTYLDQLMAGNPNQPLRLYALYRDVVTARGGHADPTDLYYPNLSFRPPKRDKAAGALKAGESDKYLREQRGRYQRGFLKWLKNDASGAEDMRAAIEAIEAAQGPPSQRAFWWVSLAFFDALAHKALPQDLDGKQLCNRIEQQIKRLGEGKPSVAERLMREVLYYVARAEPATERVREVQDAYHLGQTVPAAESGGGTVEEMPALKSAREHLGHAKDAWNKFASGNPPSLLAFCDSAAALADDAEHLGNADIAGLAGEVAGVAAWLASNHENMSEAVAPERLHARQAPAHRAGNPLARRDVAQGAGTAAHEPGCLGNAGQPAHDRTGSGCLLPRCSEARRARVARQARAPAAWGARDAWGSSRARFPGCGLGGDSPLLRRGPQRKPAGFRAHRPDPLRPGLLHRGPGPRQGRLRSRDAADRCSKKRGSRRRPAGRNRRGADRRAAARNSEPLRGMES